MPMPPSHPHHLRMIPKGMPFFNSLPVFSTLLCARRMLPIAVNMFPLPDISLGFNKRLTISEKFINKNLPYYNRTEFSLESIYYLSTDDEEKNQACIIWNNNRIMIVD